MYKLTAPCLFGVEAILKNEIKDLGYNIVKVDDGKVTFEGDELAICRSNLWLRTAERVLLTVGEF
jgi:putative N6-adenine-specific DNA methylase